MNYNGFNEFHSKEELIKHINKMYLNDKKTIRIFQINTKNKYIEELSIKKQLVINFEVE